MFCVCLAVVTAAGFVYSATVLTKYDSRQKRSSLGADVLSFSSLHQRVAPSKNIRKTRFPIAESSYWHFCAPNIVSVQLEAVVCFQFNTGTHTLQIWCPTQLLTRKHLPDTRPQC